jgi:hypothetical protein
VRAANNGIRIDFPNPRSIVVLLLLSIGVTPFLIMFVLAVPRGGRILLLCLWCVALVDLWVRRERVEITDTMLVHVSHHVGLPFRRAYEVSHIRRLRPAPMMSYTPKGGIGLRLPGLAFDYGARTVFCGTGIHEAEAVMLIDVIARRFPQLAPETR